MTTVVGHPIPRLDGPDKVTGAARYVDDLVEPGMLHGWTVRSRDAHARIDAVRLDPDYDWTGIAVVTAADVLAGGGENVIHLMDDDQPALAVDRVHHPAEPIALVAAATRERAREAAAHVIVETTPLEPELDMEGDVRVARDLRIGRGDLAAAFARADRVVEATYRTGSQEHIYIEPQGVIAIPREDGGMTVKGSLQCPFYVLRALERVLGLPAERIAVIQTVTGGGFGGKEEYPSMLAAHASLLARHTGRPVKIVYERGEDMRATTKRHAAVVRHRTGVMADGTLVCADIELRVDAGAYVTLTPVVLSRAVLHAAGPYRMDAVQIRGRAMLTHSVPAGAFRGFGAPQVTFAYERHMDRIARELDIDPLALRRRNMFRRGDLTPTGQVLDESFGADAVLAKALERSDYVARRQASGPVLDAPDGRRLRRGVGLSFFHHGAGFTGNGEAKLKGKVALDLLSDGRLRIRSASTDIGQGTCTIFPQIAAEVLGIAPEGILMATPDTSQVPDSGPTVASRTTMVVGKVVHDAATEVARRVATVAADGPFEARARAYVAAHGPLTVNATFESPPNIAWDDATYQGDAYPCFAWAADVVEVTVDMDTAEVRVDRLTTAHDAGRIIHPVLAEGQVEGGTLQALGFATMERVIAPGGVMLNDRLTNYIIPTALDAPEMDVSLVESPYGYGPYGAKGLGEIPMDGGAPAVLAAIEDALGVPVPDEVPLLPERLLATVQEVTAP